MGIVTLIKQLLPTKRRERLARVRSLPAGQQPVEAGSVFYTECFDLAVRFVQEQIARGDDSPFRGLQRDRFFHEILAMEFWALEKVLVGKHESLMDRVFEAYAKAFPGAARGAAGPPAWVADRFAAYTATWNDITGHQDEFGRKVGEYLFAAGQAYSVPETSFWIIEHAHEAQDDLREVRNLCRSMKIRLG